MAQAQLEEQPYDIILAGAFGVGKSTVFRQLSSEVHSEHLYSSCPGGAGTSTTSLCSRHLDRWTHSALVLEDTIKVWGWISSHQGYKKDVYGCSVM